MPFVRRLCARLLILGVFGCGGAAERVAVSGTVTLDNEPLAGAVVVFYPDGSTGELGGSGTTDADGKYTLKAARGDGGLVAGEYIVVVSRPLRPDGSAPLPDIPPAESDARETLPAVYSSRTASILRAKVSRETPTHPFALKRRP